MKRAIFVIPLIVLAACQRTPTSPDESNVMLPDVPAPDGLTYTRNDRNTTPAGIRVVRQELSGKGSVKDVAQFYRDVMPKHDWTPTGDEGKDVVKLKFTKKLEDCWIEVASTIDGVKVNVKVDYKQ